MSSSDGPDQTAGRREWILAAAVTCALAIVGDYVVDEGMKGIEGTDIGKMNR